MKWESFQTKLWDATMTFEPQKIWLGWFGLDIQVNLCQKLLFLHQITHNMTTLPVQYLKIPWGEYENMRRTCCAHKLFFVLTFRIICAHNLFSPCSEFVVFMYWTGKSRNNLLSYCGLVDPRISASDKDLPVLVIVVWVLKRIFWQFYNRVVILKSWNMFF